MELEELKLLWNEHDKKLDKSLRLNMHLLREMNFGKAIFKMKVLFFIKLMECAFLALIIAYLAIFIARYFAIPEFSISAIMLGLLLISVFVLVVRQFSIVIQLQLKSYDKAVAPLQKKIGHLKILIVTGIRSSLLLLPLYPLLLLIAGKVFLHVDFFDVERRNYFIANVYVAAALLPLTIWLYIELSRKELIKPWVRNILSGSGWFQAEAADKFLKDIEKFEKEE